MSSFTIIKNNALGNIYVYICINLDGKQLDSKLKPGLIFILSHKHIP